jgi:hypothetical protein
VIVVGDVLKGLASVESGAFPLNLRSA